AGPAPERDRPDRLLLLVHAGPAGRHQLAVLRAPPTAARTLQPVVRPQSTNPGEVTGIARLALILASINLYLRSTTSADPEGAARPRRCRTSPARRGPPRSRPRRSRGRRGGASRAFHGDRRRAPALVVPRRPRTRPRAMPRPPPLPGPRPARGR